MKFIFLLLTASLGMNAFATDFRLESGDQFTVKTKTTVRIGVDEWVSGVAINSNGHLDCSVQMNGGTSRYERIVESDLEFQVVLKKTSYGPVYSYQLKTIYQDIPVKSFVFMTKKYNLTYKELSETLKRSCPLFVIQ